MANIFEELMQSHSRLTESLKSNEQSKCNCKKINCNKIKLESLRLFEEADFDELDAEFAVDPEETTEDEVVLIIDPELPTDEEVPEDAATNLVGDYVYKCSICGANYVCDPNGENEFLSVDENGVPVECPVCGDDSEQILIGEIAPADTVAGKEEDEEREMDSVEVEDEESDREEVEFEEKEEFEEESVKAPRKPRASSARATRKPRAAKESVDVNVKVDTDEKVKVETEVGDEEPMEVIDDTFETEFEVEAKRPPRKLKKDEKDEKCKGDKCKDGKCEEKKEGCKSKTESNTRRPQPRTRKPITKVEGTRRPVNKASASRINRTRAIKEAKTVRKTNDMKKKPSSNFYSFKEQKFESLMTKMIQENYKTKELFKVNRAFLTDGKLNFDYSVGKKKGTFVAEGFDKKATKMKLRIRDKGVFTESYTKIPSFIVECVCVNKTVIPMRIRYNFTKQVKESLYRVRGEVK